MNSIISFVARVWVSAIEQLGPAGAVLAAMLVAFVVAVLVLAVVGMASLRAMRDADTPQARPDRPPLPISRRRRLKLRRLVDQRVGMEAANVVDLRGQQR